MFLIQPLRAFRRTHLRLIEKLKLGSADTKTLRDEEAKKLGRVSESTEPNEWREAKTLFSRVGMSIVEPQIVPKDFEEEKKNVVEADKNPISGQERPHEAPTGPQ